MIYLSTSCRTSINKEVSDKETEYRDYQQYRQSMSLYWLPLLPWVVLTSTTATLWFRLYVPYLLFDPLSVIPDLLHLQPQLINLHLDVLWLRNILGNLHLLSSLWLLHSYRCCRFVEREIFWCFLKLLLRWFDIFLLDQRGFRWGINHTSLVWVGDRNFQLEVNWGLLVQGIPESLQVIALMIKLEVHYLITSEELSLVGATCTRNLLSSILFSYYDTYMKW